MKTASLSKIEQQLDLFDWSGLSEETKQLIMNLGKL